MGTSAFNVFYRELRSLAAHLLKDERPGHTLQPTALVHEAFLRLAGDASMNGLGRARFLALAATVMRNVLVDHARAHNAAKRSVPQRITLDEGLAASPAEVDLQELDQALDRLAVLDPRQARIVEMRFFGGMSNSEVAEVLDVSEKTVVRDWVMARAWLKRQLGGDEGPAVAV